MIDPQNNMARWKPAARFVVRRPAWASATLAGVALLLGASCSSKNASPDAATLDDAAQQRCEGDGGPAALAALAACIDKARYVADVTFVAAERTPGSAHWREVQDLCATRLTELGYEVERQTYATGVNVVGLRRGTSTPDDVVLLSAHYDHIAGCAGADDNGSGVASVLEAARVLATQSYARTLVVACWDEEERKGGGYTSGSVVYAQRGRERGDVIVGNFVLDGIGYATSEPDTQELPAGLELFFGPQVEQIRANQSRGDFLMVVLDAASHGAGELLITYAGSGALPIVLLEVPADRLTDPNFRDLRRSDHSSFWDEGYPGLLLTDTANFRSPWYHCEGGPDTVDTLNHDFTIGVVRATTAAIAHMLANP